MNERETSIAEAAIRVYSRLGVRRTTMSDIATEAGVTRQTVYNAFSNTDEVLRAAIRLYVNRQWQKILDGWATADDLDGRLDVLLRHFVLDTWEYLASSDQAAELAGGYNAAGRDEIDKARQRFHGGIAELFVPAKRHLKDQGTTPEALSDFISLAIEGIKYNTKTRTDVEAAVSTLKASILALVEPNSQRRLD